MSQRVESPGLGDAGNAILNGGNEATPLLSSPVYESEDEDQDQDTTPDGDSGPNQPLKSTSSISHHHRSRCTWPWIYVVALTIAIAIVSDIGENLYGAPRLRLFESVICTRHYLVHDPSRVDDHGAVPEQLCKIDPVQDKLAQVLGWQFFFDSVPAILLPIPYGYLADKYGRKWFLVLALAGLTLSYASTLYLIGVVHSPIEYVWLSSLCFLIGGGPTTGTTLLTTIVADVVPPRLRGTVFFYRFCTDLVADLTIPPVTAYLMSKDLWIPLLGSVLFQGLSGLLLLVVPETLPIAPETSEAQSSPQAPGSLESSEPAARFTRWKRWMWDTITSFGPLTSDATIVTLVLTFLISKVGRQSTNILFQYASKRYGWTLAQAGLLQSLRAAVNIALFVAILPLIASVTLRRLSVTAKDLLLAKGSIVLLVLGALGLFFSASPAAMIISVILFTLGTGFPPTVRSLVTSLVEAKDDGAASDIGRLYALISAMEGIGMLVAAPGMAWAFRYGISLGQEWTGLPFGFAAMLFALVSIIVFSIRLEDSNA